MDTKQKIKLAGILYRLVRVFNNTNEKNIKRNGINYHIDLSEGIDLSLYLFGNFQSHVSKNKRVNIPKDGVILDVGANIGVMALQFAELVPKGKVYAFEPTHEAGKRLRENIRLNPELSDRIEVIQTFISSGEIEAENIVAYASWKVDGKQDSKPTHPVHLGQALSTENVGMITLDAFADEKNLSRIDFIKIDTDGHEPDVLKGAKKCIQKFKPTIIFEIGKYVMEEKNISFQFYTDYFGSLGYTLMNSANGKIIDNSNWQKIIPNKGTIDILALPSQKQ